MKQELFTLRAWYCWLIHNLVVLGLLSGALLFAMQWSGVTVQINLPTIEHTFKGR
jgi:hypothetical protein